MSEKNTQQMIAVLLLVLAMAPSLLLAHGDETGSAQPLPQGGVLAVMNESATAAKDTGPARLMVSAFPLQAAVPRLSEFTLQARYENGSALEHAVFDVRLVQTEDDKVVFATRLHDHEGLVHFSYGFNDGSQHRLEVTLMQQAEDEVTQPVPPLHREYLINVEPQQPPWQLQLRVLVNLFLFFAGGALVGRWGGTHLAAKARHA